jgi:hypothetical protein
MFIVRNKRHVSTLILAIGVVFVGFCISGSSVNPADVYLPQLKAKDGDVRIAALRELLTSLDSRIPDAMLALLSDEGNSIRRLAARAIGSRWWQIPKEKSEIYVNALQQNLRAESEFQDEKNMAERAIGLLTRRYDSKMFSRSPNGRWVIYERRGLPCLIDTSTDTEELLGWPRDQSVIDLFMPASGNETLEGNTPDERYVSWHPHEEAAALEIWYTRRATSVWIWQHKSGLHKLDRSQLIKSLQPKGKIDEPNPLTAEIKEWKGDDLYVSVGWGRDDLTGNAVIAWNLSQHKSRMISKEYHHGSAE